MDNPCSCKSVIIENTERNFTVQTNSIDKKLRPYINFIYEIDFDGDLRYDGAFSTKLSLDTPVEELLEKCARIFSMFEKYGKLVQPEYLDEQFEFCCADAEQVHDLSNGNGNRIKDVHCKVLSADEFRALLYEMYGSSVYTDFSADGLYVGRTEADIPVEDLHERLAEKLNVCEVTSIHIDDSEPTGVWISVITTAMDM